MPSRVEPCGLNQMYAMRYGTVPIVRTTGGLKDTVTDFGDEGGSGIRFYHATVGDVCHAISRALELFSTKTKFTKIRKTVMQLDHSWDKAAQQYLDLYTSLNKIYVMSNAVISIILGGGAGTRLYPLTRSRSKPAVPVAGKYRLVDIPISNCLNADLHRIFVLTQFNSASLNKHIKNTYHFSHFSKAFVDILAAEQTPDNPTWFQGTADAVRQTLRHLENFEFEYVLILSGDQLYQMDFREMIQQHIDKGADISIATIPVNAKDATDFGILKTNEDNLITSFIEKPKKELLPDWTSIVSPEMQREGREYLASMGIYIFNKQLLFDLLSGSPEATDFGKEIIPNSIDEHKVLSFQYEGYWTDIGNISSFFEANLGLTDDIPQFNLFDDHQTIFSRARMLPPAKISGTTLEKNSDRGWLHH